MDKEKIVQINSSIDKQVDRTVFIALTDIGNLFKSYDLKIWDIVTLPDFKDKELKLKETRLNG